MSIPNERSSLIRNNNDRALSYTIQPANRTAGLDLTNYAQGVLSNLRNDPSGPLPIGITDPDVELAGLLYALHLLEAPPLREEDVDMTIRLADGLLDAKVGTRLREEVGVLLDKGGVGDDSQVDDERLSKIMWWRWETGTSSVSALELLSASRSGRSPFMSHPLIILFVDQLYYHGLPSPDMGRRSMLRALESTITPQRAQVLHFISFAALSTLTTLITLRPTGWASNSSGVNGLDITWTIFALGLLGQAFQHPPPNLSKNITPLPTSVAPLIYPISKSAAFTALQLSIPALTIAILLPAPISIPFLFPSLLPVSVRLSQIIKAGFTGWNLVWPLLLLLFGMFSFSLNGDIYRGFFVEQSTSPIGPDTRRVGSGTEPTEDGVSPYGTRVAIFCTIILLLYFSICLSISGMVRALRSGNTDEGTTMSHRPHDWESRHGTYAARRARGELVRGSRWLIGDTGIGSAQAPPPDTEDGTENVESIESPPSTSQQVAPPLPIPLNLLLLPLDMFIGPHLLVSRVRGRVVSRTTSRISGLRHWVSVIALGMPCYAMSLLRVPSTRRHVAAL